MSTKSAAADETPALAGISSHFRPETRANPRESRGEWIFPPAAPGNAALAAIVALCLAACGTAPKRAADTKPTPPAKTGGYYLDDGPGDNPPVNLDSIPDAVPRIEPLHRAANRPYTVFGRTYVPNVAAEPFRQQGVASWYGRKYHGQKTSIGEVYDMYAMTAAHPTLPLPSYARVTNPANMKSVVVRVNDRGPFLSERIIDLSYAAAARLDIARKGSGMVIVERVLPGETVAATTQSPAPSVAMPLAPAAAPATAIVLSPVVPDAGELYLQLAAFSSADNAENFRARMARELEWNREPLQVVQKDNLHRVRMGPYKTREEAEAVAAQIRLSHDFPTVIQKP